MFRKMYLLIPLFMICSVQADADGGKSGAARFAPGAEVGGRHATMYELKLKAGQLSATSTLKTFDQTAMHRIEYVSCIADVQQGQSVWVKIETPTGFAPLVLKKQGMFEGRDIFVASEMVQVSYPPQPGSETSPLSARRIDVTRSQAQGEATVRVFVSGSYGRTN